MSRLRVVASCVISALRSPNSMGLRSGKRPMMLFTISNYYLPKIYSEITPIEGVNLGIDFTTVKLQASPAI